MCWDLPSTRAEMTLPAPIRDEYCGQLTNQRAVFEMTLPSADSERLILVASFSRAPVASVLACRSLPARSTRFNLPWKYLCLLEVAQIFIYVLQITFLMWPSPPESIISMLMVNMEWDLALEIWRH